MLGMYDGTEADWMDDVRSHDEDDYDEAGDEYFNNVRSSQSEVWNNNASAKVGSKCHCPVCGRNFVKKSYQQKFCPSKKGRSSKCKDKYWNLQRDYRA
jgi:hypothetical protein